MHTPFPDCGKEPLGLYPLVDSSAWVKKLLDLGVSTIQLRIKNKEGAALEREIKDSIAVARAAQARIFINDYWELAIRHAAYGIHLGQEDLDKADIIAVHESGLRLGVSSHSFTEVDRCLALKPSYVAFGPIFPTTSKILPYDPQGTDKLAHWIEQISYPVVAIGGINLERLPKVLETGVNGVAVIAAITQAQDPIKSTKDFMRMIKDHQSKSEH